MNQPNQVQEKAPKPPGLLPKNVQSWLLISLALADGPYYVADRGQETADPNQGHSARADGASAARSQRRQNRRTAKPHSGVAARAARGRERSRATEPSHRAPRRRTCRKRSSPAQRATAPPTARKMSIRAERKKREYLSLFSSNVALSYRKPPRWR